MHIALLSPAWPPGAHPNGIVTYVHCLREELLRQGHRVSVLTTALDPSSRDISVHSIRRGWRERASAVVAGWASRRSPSVFDYGETIAHALTRLHANDPIDVLEMEESFGFSSRVVTDVSIPVVVRLHGPAFLHMVEEELNTDYGAEKVRREGAALEIQRVITSPSKWTLEETVARYRLRPLIAERISNPIDVPTQLPLWSLARCDRKMVLFVGRFDKIKGADILLVAFAELLRTHPDLKLVFVGPDKGLVRKSGAAIHFHDFVADLGGQIAPALSYRGPLDREEITHLRSSALVTIVPSRLENQPYTALEAMLQGCPVVCADTSGLSEVIEHNVTGLKAAPEDPTALAGQIRRIVDDPAFGQALGAAAREHVLEHHSAATVVRQTLDTYRRAIEVGCLRAR